MRYDVVVGNIGTVYSGGIQRIAERHFDEYVSQSKSGYGRAGGEDVTLMKNGEPKHEYMGTIAQTLAESDEDA